MKKLLTGILIIGAFLSTTSSTFASCPITTSDNQTVKQECACPKDCTCGCQEGKGCTCDKNCKCNCPQNCTCGCKKGEQCTCSEDCTCGCQENKDCTCDKCPQDCNCGCQDKENINQNTITNEQTTEPVKKNPETTTETEQK